MSTRNRSRSSILLHPKDWLIEIVAKLQAKDPDDRLSNPPPKSSSCYPDNWRILQEPNRKATPKPAEAAEAAATIVLSKGRGDEHRLQRRHIAD